ncbi:ribonuclease H-like domain-containing protein [Sphingomonas floccifaciens]|uniref:Ribonuclease H-like domain-containing protein n=1 Tax=Sphingomonas floccifaciens TaxID=1844115 RepID=A0ABW4NFG2_9SPHN
MNIVLDIETVADLNACENAGVDPAAGFPAWPLHQLLCVSLLTVQRDRDQRHKFGIETFSRSMMSERAIVAEVERRLEGCRSLLTYNGRGFDIPVLLARAAMTGEHTPMLLRAGSRSNAGFHTDLLDEITCQGAAVRPRLIDVCAGFGIPAKLDLAGTSVAELAAQGHYGRIERYCESDVISTWLAAQMWRSTQSSHPGIEHWRELAAWIFTNQPRLSHLLPYVPAPSVSGGGASLSSHGAYLIDL